MNAPCPPPTMHTVTHPWLPFHRFECVAVHYLFCPCFGRTSPALHGHIAASVLKTIWRLRMANTGGSLVSARRPHPTH
jgi:hypothetical protein